MKYVRFVPSNSPAEWLINYLIGDNYMALNVKLMLCLVVSFKLSQYANMKKLDMSFDETQ